MSKEGSVNAELMKTAEKTAFLAGKKRVAAELLFCALSGWAFTVIFEEISWYIFAWAGLLPLFLMTYSRSKKRAFLYGFVWGYFWHLGSFFWLREIFFAIPFAMAAVLGIFNGIFAMMIPFFHKYLLYPPSSLTEDWEKRNTTGSFSSFREILFALATASLWTCLEYIRSHIFTGFPWNLLGASQWKMVTLIQIADLTGIYGLSFILVLFNSVLFTLFLTTAGFLVPCDSPLRSAFILPASCSKKERQEGRFLLFSGKNYRRPFALMFALALLAFISSYSFVKLRQFRNTERKSITLYAGAVQPNLSQRRHGGDDSIKEALAVCTKLSEQLFQEGKQKPHVVIWPETAVPTPFNASLENSALLRRELYRMIRQHSTPFLFGSIRLDKSPDGKELLMFNSAILWEKGNLVSSFDKVHIVPFGEFVPFGDTFPVLNRIVGMGRNLSRGTKFNPLPLITGVRAGISICYEDVFPYVSRNHVLNGANLLLTITNDAWYPTSYEPAQHCANSVFRAVECRLPFLRVGNLDYSCVAAPWGGIVSALGYDEKGRPDPSLRCRKSGILPVQVPQEYTPTFYVKYGDVFSGGCFALLIFLFFCTFSNYRKEKQDLLEALNGTEKKTDQA